MARQDYESSPESGQPVSLFLFRYGPDPADYYALTNAEDDITHDDGVTGPIVYSALWTPQQQDNIVAAQVDGGAEIKILVPLVAGKNGAANPVTELFRIYPPTQVVTITIREGHQPNANDPAGWATGENFPVVWLGRVLEAEREDEHAVLSCDSSAITMTRPGLRRFQQVKCGHTLYRGRCGASKAAFESPGTAAAVNGNQVSLNTGWIFAGRQLSDYNRGFLEWDGAVGRVRRRIVRVGTTDTDPLILSGPASELLVSGAVDAYIGCPREFAFCRDVHGVPNDYGGFLGIPKTNPTGKNQHT